MSSLPCPKNFTITITNPVIPPIFYYKLEAIGAGNAAIDSGPYGLDTNINAGGVTIVAGIITNAHMWGTAGVRFRNTPDAHLDLTGLDWTLRAWIKFNALPGFFYNYPIYLTNTRVITLSAKGVGGTLPIPGSDSECRPYFGWTGGKVWADQTNTASVCKDLAWHRVVVRYDFATNTPGITLDNGTEDTTRVGVVFPAVTTIAPRMAGPDNLGAPNNDLSTCEIGLWPYRWSDAEMLSDWAGGAGTTYP